MNFYMKNILKTGTRYCNRSRNIGTYEGKKLFLKAGNQVHLSIVVNFHAPRSGSAFPVRIRIQDSQINADPCRSGSGSTTLSKRQRMRYSRYSPLGSHDRYYIGTVRVHTSGGSHSASPSSISTLFGSLGKRQN